MCFSGRFLLSIDSLQKLALALIVYILYLTFPRRQIQQNPDDERELFFSSNFEKELSSRP